MQCNKLGVPVAGGTWRVEFTEILNRKKCSAVKLGRNRLSPENRRSVVKNVRSLRPEGPLTGTSAVAIDFEHEAP